MLKTLPGSACSIEAASTVPAIAAHHLANLMFSFSLEHFPMNCDAHKACPVCPASEAVLLEPTNGEVVDLPGGVRLDGGAGEGARSRQGAHPVRARRLAARAGASAEHRLRDRADARRLPVARHRGRA